MSAERTRRIELDPHPEDKPITRVQLKFTRAALERLIGDNFEVETILGHQVVQSIVDRHTARIQAHLEELVANGLDLNKLHIKNVVLSDGLRDRVRTEVGNYLRTNEYQIRAWINEEIAKQVPEQIKSAVSTALKQAVERVLADVQPKR